MEVVEEKKQQSVGTEGVRNRIIVIVGVMLVLLWGTGIFGIFETGTLIQTGTEQVVRGQNIADARKAAQRTIGIFKDQIHEWKNVLLRGHNKADFDKYHKAFMDQNQAVLDALQQTKAAYQTAESDTAALDEFVVAHDKLVALCNKTVQENDLADNDSVAKADAAVRGMDRPVTAILDASIEKISKDYAKFVETSTAQSQETGFRAKLISYISLALGVVAGIASFPILLKSINAIIASIRTALNEAEGQRNEAEKQKTATDTLRQKIEEEYRSLQNNILDLLKAVSDASEGNLASRAKVTEGALGNVADAFNQMMEAFGELVTEIQKLANNTLTMADEIGTSSEQLAAGATSQAAELVNANQSVTSMGLSLQKVSENAGTAALAARRTQDSAQAGSNSAQNVVKGMEVLRQNVQAGAKKIKNLGDRSMEITGIVGAIAKISDQTNMLALNAAIEAARAGEHGRGFSVVADEVRKLAERTATATQEIERLVKDIQTETNESVAAIEQQTQVVEEQAGVVNNAGESLLKIQQAGTESAELIGDISNSSIQQAQGASLLVQTMQRVSGIAQSTKERVEKTLKSSRELANLATNLNRSVGKFKLS